MIRTITTTTTTTIMSAAVIITTAPATTTTTTTASCSRPETATIVATATTQCVLSPLVRTTITVLPTTEMTKIPCKKACRGNLCSRSKPRTTLCLSSRRGQPLCPLLWTPSCRIGTLMFVRRYSIPYHLPLIEHIIVSSPNLNVI